MAPFIHRLLRAAVLGMMLLLAGSFDFTCVSYDADADDDTPPVTVEMSLAAPCKKSLNAFKSQNHAGVRGEKGQTQLLIAVAFESDPLLAQRSPQLVVPLRT
ncbi:MAG TPA: hypothetical protein VGP89_05645 [Candidatus Angelobacter sp.]|nr:hypothetical protein [Candidatus Angelobacter sp.]